MKVRDLSLEPDDYKGRITDAEFADCPCRDCYNAHNCARTDERYFTHPDMRCATRENGRCRPEGHPAHHDYRAGRCERCGSPAEFPQVVRGEEEVQPLRKDEAGAGGYPRGRNPALRELPARDKAVVGHERLPEGADHGPLQILQIPHETYPQGGNGGRG